MMQITLAFLLAASLAGPSDDLRRAIENNNLEQAATAIDEVKSGGGRTAIRALAKAFDSAAKMERYVQAEMAALQASVADETKKQNSAGKAKYKAQMNKLGSRASALQGIKLAIGLAFGNVRGDVLGELIKLIKGRGDGELRAYLAAPLSRSPDMSALFALLVQKYPESMITSEGEIRVALGPNHHERLLEQYAESGEVDWALLAPNDVAVGPRYIIFARIGDSDESSRKESTEHLESDDGAPGIDSEIERTIRKAGRSDADQ